MKANETFWQPFEFTFNKEILDALLHQHHAAQFIALTGRHLVPHKRDDSHTNMKFHPESGSLSGHPFQAGWHLVLQLSDLSLCIKNRTGECQSMILLPGMSKREVFDELRIQLSVCEVDVSHLKNELHYEMPAHALDSGSIFRISNPQHIKENIKYRYNAEIVLNEIVATFDGTEPVRIWPHHFDTGTTFVKAKNDPGEATQTIGIGWAIPDSMVNEPYYYLSFWSETEVDEPGRFPGFDAGEWMMPEWNGAILKHSDILKAGSAKDQYQMVKSFYHSGMNILMHR